MKRLTTPIPIFLLTIFLHSCCINKFTTCPDGRPVSFPRSEKCAKKNYQDAVKEFSFNLKGSLDAVDQITASVDNLEVKNEAKLLREKLDQQSIRLQEALKSSYLGLVRDPCGSSERHFKIIESVNAKSFELQKLQAELKNKTEIAEIKTTFNEYLYQRGKKEGEAMGRLVRSIDNYYSENLKYPNDLSQVNVADLVALLASSRLDYKQVNDNEYSLKFAGQDFVLGTSDDKIYIGKEGNTIKAE